MTSRILTCTLAIVALVTALTGCGSQQTTSTSSTTTPGSTAAAQTTSSTSPTTQATSSASTSSTSTSTSTTHTVTHSATQQTTAASTTSAARTPTRTSTIGCGGDCVPKGTPSAAGTSKPVNGKCPSGATYLPPQDGGPALCVGGPTRPKP